MPLQYALNLRGAAAAILFRLGTEIAKQNTLLA
jgi:hypothetical protein